MRGSIYEHWRPDLNHCFYVGATLVGEKRAKDFSPRNPEYKKIVEELKSKNLQPFCVMVWSNLEKDSLGTYEKIRISYQKALNGPNLTNIALGGFGFFLTTEKNRELQKEAQNRPEVNAKRSFSLRLANAKPEVIKRRSDAAKLAHTKPEVKLKHQLAEANPQLRELRKKAAQKGAAAAASRTPQARRQSALQAVETRRKKQQEKLK